MHVHALDVGTDGLKSRYFLFHVLLLRGRPCSIIPCHELLKDLQKDGLVLGGVVKLGTAGQVRRVGSSALQVGFGPEDVQRIVHFVEFKELPNQLATEHALSIRSCLAGVRVLPVELAAALVLILVLLVDALEHA